MFRPRSRGGRHPAPGGYSLVELMVVLVVLSIVLGALMVSTTSMQRQLGEQRRRSEATDALLAAETFLTNLLRGAEANPFRVSPAAGFRYINPDSTIWSEKASYQWATGETAFAFAGIQVFSDFNPGDGRWDDPFEDATVVVSNRSLQVTWQAVSGGPTNRVDIIASPIDSLWISYYSAARQPINDQTSLVAARQVRFRVKTAVRIAGRDVFLTRERWVYLRNR